MKAIMISIKPKWCAKIMNGEKTIEARKNKALASAIQKLIDEYGYADFYGYCTKDEQNNLFYEDMSDDRFTDKKPYQLSCVKNKYLDEDDAYLNGKVPFKFRCYKVEELSWQIGVYELEQQSFIDFLDECCLGFCEFKNYLNKKNGYAIHISDLEIFDKPKELWEFQTTCNRCEAFRLKVCKRNPKKCDRHLTKAPQNFCYVEVER